MIEEATVDAYNDDEQLTGLFTEPFRVRSCDVV